MSRERFYANQGNPELLALFDARARSVLDVGCGAGDNARLLAQRGCVVDGVTISEREAQAARVHMRACWVADLEAGLPTAATEQRYDCVLLSHVLEHLRQPELLVRQATTVLADGGTLLIAVPNVLNWRERSRFAAGHFEYQDAGVLDRTHLRFFTYESADRLLLQGVAELTLESKTVSGSVPLWWLRRHLLPGAWSTRIDALGCQLVPGLFGSQILLRARRSSATPSTRSAPSGPQPRATA